MTWLSDKFMSQGTFMPCYLLVLPFSYTVIVSLSKPLLAVFVHILLNHYKRKAPNNLFFFCSLAHSLALPPFLNVHMILLLPDLIPVPDPKCFYPLEYGWVIQQKKNIKKLSQYNISYHLVSVITDKFESFLYKDQ